MQASIFLKDLSSPLQLSEIDAASQLQCFQLLRHGLHKLAACSMSRCSAAWLQCSANSKNLSAKVLSSCSNNNNSNTNTVITILILTVIMIIIVIALYHALSRKLRAFGVRAKLALYLRPRSNAFEPVQILL